MAYTQIIPLPVIVKSKTGDNLFKLDYYDAHPAIYTWVGGVWDVLLVFNGNTLTVEGILDALFPIVNTANWFLNQIVGGAEGIYCYPSVLENSFKVVATVVPSMSVTVKEGALFKGSVPDRNSADQNTVAMVAPVANSRIDLVSWSIATHAVVVTPGAEAPVPVVPATPVNCTALAKVYHRVGSVHIDNADDGVNSYITDLRVLINV